MKDLARTTPIDFHIPQLYKKQKSGTLSTKSNIPTPFPIKSRFRSSSFYFNPTPFTINMSSHKQQSRTRSISPEVISISSSGSSDDDLDSLTDRIQNLDLYRTKEEEENELDKKKPELFELRKNVLNIISEPTLDTEEFDKLYEKTEIKLIKEAVKPLTDVENKLVSGILREGQSGIVAQFNKCTVSYSDIYRLYPETWLNDEIVNYHFELLSQRAISKQDTPEKNTFPTIHCFNTFFCSTLRDQGFAKVKRWTKRVDIFSKELVFVPINQSYHWVLGVMDMKKKTVYVYDSLGGNHDTTLTLFLKYLQEEHLDKKKLALDISDWKKETPKNIPRQGNMSDCGAFACTFAERLSRREVFNFSQDDMTHIRRRMVLNIINKSI